MIMVNVMTKLVCQLVKPGKKEPQLRNYLPRPGL